MHLVPPVHRDQVRRHRLHLPGIAQATAEDAADACDATSQRLDDVSCLPLVTEDENVCVDHVDRLIKEQDRRDVMEGRDDTAVGKDARSLLGGRSFFDAQCEGTLLIEAERVHAVDDDLPRQFLPE